MGRLYLSENRRQADQRLGARLELRQGAAVRLPGSRELHEVSFRLARPNVAIQRPTHRVTRSYESGSESGRKIERAGFQEERRTGGHIPNQQWTGDFPHHAPPRTSRAVARLPGLRAGIWIWFQQ
jgi:hypothetical protein